MLHFAEFAAFIYFCFVLFSHFLLIHFTQKSPHRGTEMGNGKREVGKWEVAWAANCWHLVVAYFVYFLISLLFHFFSFLLMPLVGTAREMISLFFSLLASLVLYFVNYFSLFSGCCGTCPSDLANRQTDRQRETSDRLWLSDYNENESCDCVEFFKRKLFTES